MYVTVSVFIANHALYSVFGATKVQILVRQIFLMTESYDFRDRMTYYVIKKKNT